MLRLATRGSPQAFEQSSGVSRAIEAATGIAVELVVVQTTGDLRTDIPLHVIGGQGIFVKEVQRAVLDGRADLAAHSSKDLPSETEVGLEIGAFCARRDARDTLIGSTLDRLPTGATVATGAVRRRAQLSRRRPDLTFVELRGNIGRRLERIPDGGAIVMAAAALEVLGLTDRVDEFLDVVEFVPAVGQGCVAVECRSDDDRALAALRAIDDHQTRAAVEIERAFLAQLGAGCSMPVGAHVAHGLLHTFLADLDTGVSVGDVIELHDGPGAASQIANCDLARSAARSLLDALA